MITYAGIPLILEDPDQVFQTWLDRWFSLDDLRLWGQPTGSNNRTSSRGAGQAAVGIPTLNWPASPRARLNSLWWPTGASRWAVGLFLVDSVRLDEIISAVGNGESAELDIRQSDTDQDIHPQMFMLPPRQITPLDTGTQGWLLPLVDERYFWQFRDAGSMEIEDGQTWEQVFDELASQLSTAITYDSISSSYYSPDPIELTRRYESLSVLLDAVAACVGQRIVYTTGNQLQSQGHASSAGIVKSNLETSPSSYNRLAGGKMDSGAVGGLRPSQVRVVFPRYELDAPQESGDVFAVTRAASLYGVTATQEAGTVKTFFDTAGADFTSDPTVPHNLATLQYLAGQVASDYYAGLSDYSQFDLSFPGLKIWTQTGFDDAIWFHVGGQDEKSGEYSCFTRVSSLPPNFGVCELLHQVVSGSEYSSASKSSGQSSQSYSSQSSQSTGDGYTRVEVVTDVYCVDEDIVVCTRELAFPNRLGILVSEEECESSFSSSDTTSDGVTSFTSDSYSETSVSSQSLSTSSTPETLIVTGNMVPDCTGTYSAGDDYGGKTSYVGGSWVIWWDLAEEQWIISSSAGGGQAAGNSWWEGFHPQPNGPYNPMGDAVGTAIVTADNS
ncbi:MAG: hypothetical protein GY832_24225 [Chloroflexi bacterium]|nr:hypothetical protein [Chloroflexota bacterium]